MPNTTHNPIADQPAAPTAHTVEHTPGPWTTLNYSDTRDRRKLIVVAGAAAGATADVRPVIGIADGNPARESNARLIAAAPDMLESLIDCYDTFSAEAEYINGCSTRDIADKLRDIITKAKGARP